MISPAVLRGLKLQNCQHAKGWSQHFVCLQQLHQLCHEEPFLWATVYPSHSEVWNLLPLVPGKEIHVSEAIFYNWTLTFAFSASWTRQESAGVSNNWLILTSLLLQCPYPHPILPHHSASEWKNHSAQDAEELFLGFSSKWYKTQSKWTSFPEVQELPCRGIQQYFQHKSGASKVSVPGCYRRWCP